MFYLSFWHSTTICRHILQKRFHQDNKTMTNFSAYIFRILIFFLFFFASMRRPWARAFSTLGRIFLTAATQTYIHTYTYMYFKYVQPFPVDRLVQKALRSLYECNIGRRDVIPINPHYTYTATHIYIYTYILQLQNVQQQLLKAQLISTVIKFMVVFE